MTSIVSIVSRTVHVPLPIPMAMSTRSVDHREYTLVKIVDSDGCEGMGVSYTGSIGGGVAGVVIRELLAPNLIGKPAHEISALWNEMYQSTLLHGRTGITMRAISAVDIALWDLSCKKMGVPLWKRLNASSKPVEAYASGGYYSDPGSSYDIVDEMNGHLEGGFRAAKIKIGRQGAKDDFKRVDRVRQVVGEDFDLMLDANNAWTDLPTAMATAQCIEEHRPFWIEEPFGPDDIELHQRLNASTRIPVAGGEVESLSIRFKALIDSCAVDIIQPDVFACGGISEYLKIANMANVAKVMVCPHAFHDIHAPLVAAFSNSPYVEVFPNSNIVNLSEIFQEPLKVDNGRVALSDRPGIGVEIDEDRVAAFAIDEWR